MAQKNDHSLLKELFEAHLGPIREDIRYIKSRDGRIEEAHQRIDKWENRGWGFVAAATIVVSTITFLGVSGIKKLSSLIS